MAEVFQAVVTNLDVDEVPLRYEDAVVRATWKRRLPGVIILAFADSSYLIHLGARGGFPLITIGWHRGGPLWIEFERFRHGDRAVRDG